MAEYEPCSPERLLLALEETNAKPKYRAPLLTSLFNTTRQKNEIRSYFGADEVYPGVFVGNESAARDIRLLKHNGITHVINTAKGSRSGQVDTNVAFYQPHGIKFLGLELIDMPDTKIAPYFDECSEFIEDALNEKGKVLVHCLMGISRSSTIALAFLMTKRGLSAEEAIRTVRKHRNVYPNRGFLRQLCDLDNELKHNRSKRLL